MKACILDADSLGPDVDLSPILETPLDWTVWPSTRPEDRAARIGDAAVILTNKVQIDRTLLSRAPQVRYISVLATGTNNIDLSAAQELAIEVSNVRDYSTDSVVQHTLSLMFALAGNLISYHEKVGQKAWQSSPYFCYFNRPVTGLQGKNLTILGYGNQGKKLAAIAKEVGMNVHIASRPGSSLSGAGPLRHTLDELLPISDVLSFHCPLTPETENIINFDNIFRIKKGAILINCARGGLVHESALAAALEAGHLGGAGFDVATVEPPLLDHPLMNVKHPNFILTPHIAWASMESRQLLIQETAKNIQSFLYGQVRNSVLS